MSRSPQSHRRRPRRAFAPSLQERLEDRNFTSTLTPASTLLAARASVIAARAAGRGGHVQAFTTSGGRGREVTDVDNERFRVQALYNGAVRVQTAASGQAGIVVQGSSDHTEIEIRPSQRPHVDQKAHTFGTYRPYADGVLKIGQLDFSNGLAKGVFGYRTADLYGPLRAAGTSVVDRIALNRMAPGATIQTGSDLNTLDIYTDVNLSGANTGIYVGRDLNAFNVNGDVTLSNGANIVVGRDVGAFAQAAQGTGPGGKGIVIKGNMTINPGSQFIIERNVSGPIVIYGNLVGASRITVKGGIVSGGIQVAGTITP